MIPVLVGVLGIWASASFSAPASDGDTPRRRDGEAGVRACPAAPRAPGRCRFAPVTLMPVARTPAAPGIVTRSGIPRSRRPAVPPSAPPRPRAFPAAVPARAQDDPWFAEDKLKHFLLSFAVTSIGYAGARTVGAAHDPALVAGAGVGAVAGIWKELHDRATGGDVSARDLTWDGVGIAAGSVLSSQTH